MENKSIIKPLLLGFTLFTLLTGCVSLPKNIEPVNSFDLERYLGKWYEIARLDHAFERGLSQVTAEYSLREDGGVKVVNRGFKAEDNEWKQAQGKAFFVNNADEGFLKVSFFGPFYGAYVIFELGDAYEYAFVAGPNKDYLWLLSRAPTVTEEVKTKFLNLAKAKGYDLTELVFPMQK